MTEEIRAYIDTMRGEAGNFAPVGFEFSATICRLRLKGSLLSSLLNGAEEEVTFRAQPGKNRHTELLRWLAKLTGFEKAHWFFIREDSSGQPTVLLVKAARRDSDEDCPEAPLTLFETQPAEIGGAAYLGLVGASSDWLLLYTHYQEEEFAISIHGRTKLCNDLCKLVHSNN